MVIFLPLERTPINQFYIPFRRAKLFLLEMGVIILSRRAVIRHRALSHFLQVLSDCRHYKFIEPHARGLLRLEKMTGTISALAAMQTCSGVGGRTPDLKNNQARNTASFAGELCY